MNHTTDFPNLFFVGYPKCGTTVLYDYLKEHDDISAPDLKEPRFFCYDLRKEAGNAREYFPIKSKKAYCKLFPKRNRYLADFSVNYIYSRVAASRIARESPDARIIIILREPSELIASLHAQYLKNCIESEHSLKRALSLEDSRKRGVSLPKDVIHASQIFYSEWVKYADHIKRYLDYFPRENIKVILFDDFYEDNQRVVDEICEFLGLKRISITPQEFNVRSEAKSRLLRVAARRVYRLFLPLTRRIIPVKGRAKMIEIFDVLTLKPMKRQVKDGAELKRRFRHEVERADSFLQKERLLDERLVERWGYNRI